MGTTYTTCPPDVQELAKKVMRKSHPKLLAADVTLCFLFARNAENPPISKNGWPAKALVKINNLKDRVAGLADATILIDEAGWDEWDADHRLAIIDHELTHLQVRRNKVGAIAYDDANRPKLKARLHDFEVCGFHEIVQRHGASAPEAQAFAHVHAHWVQQDLKFAEPQTANA
jgi:hypothetical protein